MSKLTILRGLSGSGKSTWARSQFGAVVVSRDDLRKAIFGSDDQDYYTAPGLGQRELVINKAEHAAIVAGLSAGMHVIADSTHIEWKFVKSAADLAYKNHAEVEIKVFSCPLAVAKAQNKLRKEMGGRFVPEDVIEKQHKRFQSNKNMTVDDLTKPFIPTPYRGTFGKPQAFLFDLDGTTYHMNGKRKAYDHNVEVDDPDLTIQDLVGYLSMYYIPIAMSGRVEATRAASEKSMRRDGLPFSELFMRADGDMRKDSIVKAELFDKHIRDNYDVQFVLDDRQQVVDMWRAMGIKCLQVEPGDF